MFARSMLSVAVFFLLTSFSDAGMREEFRWPGGGEGIEIHVLHKGPDRPNGRPPVLMLHPFGAPCADAYDLPGYSWMDDLNTAGFDTWAIDFRGFARSSKPASTTPVGPAKDAVGDVKAIIAGIKRKTGVPKVSLIGWSWGGVVAAMTAADSADIDRLVLLGTMRGFVLPMMTEPFAKPDNPSTFAPANVPYQKLDASVALAHWRMMLKGIELVALPDGVEKAEALMRRCGNAMDFAGKTIVTRPMGPLADLFEIWLDRPIFEASAVKVPTLVVYGDADLFADRKLAKQLPESIEVVIPRATHWVPFEAGRTTLYEAVRKYLTD